jgi:hypothetical protein
MFGDLREGDGRPAWVHALGDALGISRRTFERMASGDARIPDLKEELRALLMAKGGELMDLAEKL